MKRDRIFDSLRREILSGELPRGSRMPQDELARRFGASITPVREALRLLEAEGLLVSEPHRGVRVAGVDLEKVKGTYVVRRLVEGYAMRRVVGRLSPRDLREIGELVERMGLTLESGDLEAFRSDNRLFHFFFYERCGLPALVDHIVAAWQAFPWDLMLESPECSEQSHLEHKAILAAVAAQDVEGSARASDAHIARGFQLISNRLGDESAVDPFDLDSV